MSTSRKHNNKYGSVFTLMKIFIIILALFITGGCILFFYYVKDTPTITSSQLHGEGSSKLYTTDGKFYMSLGLDKNRYTPISEIPQSMRDAVISIEDKRFYKEKIGLDPIRITSSTLKNIKNRAVVEGGSTITQQLIKLTLFSTKTSDRTMKRKAQEAWLAVQVSNKYSKDKILEYYLNKVYMNYNIYGVGTAAKYFYNKKLKDLNLSQTALLAGMINAPSTYDPYIFPKAATYRRNLVLKAMLNNKKITQQEYSQAIKENVQDGLIRIKNDDLSQRRKMDDPYLKEVINEVHRLGYDPYKDKLKITINMDSAAQKQLYELANNKVKFSSDKMQVGATVLDPNNGHVLAILGGRKLPNIQLGLNRAVQTDRSSGSSIKPILDYAPALEYKGWSSAQILADTPYIYRGSNTQLYNWDNAYWGNITMRQALTQSRNVPAIRALEAVGMDKATKFVKNMDIDIPKDQGLSVGIGANVSTAQLAGAYGALATEGIYYQPKFISKIETADGTVQNYNSSGKRVMKQSTAYMITDMLKDVINNGTGKSVKLKGLYQAGKTGTVKYSEDELTKYPSYANTPKDSWFVGYTKEYVISIWTGYDRLSDGKINSDGELSAQNLYKSMMKYMMANKRSTDWIKPRSVITKNVNGTREVFLKGNSTSPGSIKSNHSQKVIKKRPQQFVKNIQPNIQEDKDISNEKSVNNQSNSNTDTNSSSQTQNSQTDQEIIYYYYYEPEN